MKLVTIDAREVAGRPGVLLDSGQVLDLTAAPASLEVSQWIPQSTISILAAGERGLELAQELVSLVDRQGAELRKRGALSNLSGTSLMVPVRRPGLILVSCITENGEMQSYLKSPNTAIGHAAHIQMPSQDALMATPMLAVVLGRPLYKSGIAAAETAISAWTLMVDLAPAKPDPVTAADWREFSAARQFPGSLPMGPALITVDELEESASLGCDIRINDVATTTGLFGVPRSECAERLVALSRDYALRPGDVIGFMPRGAAAGGLTQKLHGGDTCRVSFGKYMELSFRLTR